MSHKSTSTSARRRAAASPTREAAAGNDAALEHMDVERAVPNGQIRAQMVAEAAYFRALHRGFDGGDPRADWFAAEREIDARLGGG
jgi:hypothetical protein